MTPHIRIRLGWIVLLAIACGLYLALHLQVQAVTSEIVRAERRIVALEQRKLLLATEFETRASQLQLAAWNRVDFGYTAPAAPQFLNSERQLAAFSLPPAIGTPSPIRLASAVAEGGNPRLAAMVQPAAANQPAQTIVLASADDGAGQQLAAQSARIHLAALAGGGVE
ncbi:hypothetical protein PK98_01480 [Croceibacterium mercuriale]|uniref:Uncharacterized protein n=1 Tax=Croceibacterium mercuriale TaxID=1572751 RepID=A0A0B2C098_9SPHN|nr:hypothetical protein [Croceibacterium mercuriale]KHL25411.1 hypothetical protein PK98_01480 [Croceibacterium mercuriale]